MGPSPTLWRSVAENVHHEVVAKPDPEVRLVAEIAGDALVVATEGPAHLDVSLGALKAHGPSYQTT